MYIFTNVYTQILTHICTREYSMTKYKYSLDGQTFRSDTYIDIYVTCHPPPVTYDPPISIG